MSDECRKAVMRRLYQPGFINRYFVGDGIDIGAGMDGLGQYKAQFPLMRSCRSWDVHDGDAQLMAGVLDESCDFVTSSHCLEHMRDPVEAMQNWWRILKPQGHLVILVPDKTLYEQGVWPSRWNPDHKWMFAICQSDMSTVDVVDLVRSTCSGGQLLKVELLEHTYDYSAPLHDQTQGLAESAIEFIVRK